MSNFKRVLETDREQFDSFRVLERERGQAAVLRPYDEVRDVRVDDAIILACEDRDPFVHIGIVKGYHVGPLSDVAAHYDAAGFSTLEAAQNYLEERAVQRGLKRGADSEFAALFLCNIEMLYDKPRGMLEGWLREWDRIREDVWMFTELHDVLDEDLLYLTRTLRQRVDHAISVTPDVIPVGDDNYLGDVGEGLICLYSDLCHFCVDVMLGKVPSDMPYLEGGIARELLTSLVDDNGALYRTFNDMIRAIARVLREREREKEIIPGLHLRRLDGWRCVSS